MISIRKAEESDISQLEKLFLNSRQKTFTWENPDKFKLSDYMHATDGETVFVAENINGKIIGFMSVWGKDKYPFIHHLSGKIFGGLQAFLGSESIYIETLWVERNLQKQGYGKQLLDAAERGAVKNGCVFSAVDTFDF